MKNLIYLALLFILGTSLASAQGYYFVVPTNSVKSSPQPW
ncbi:hypothetical protein SAMN04488490_0506 [Marinobacter sp. LV10R510-11A]|nr:hypothetical protein SAMN04488490_0506 [Marinobacter sp. LV10R510-11A]